jgi:hypothetical protein
MLKDIFSGVLLTEATTSCSISPSFSVTGLPGVVVPFVVVTTMFEKEVSKEPFWYTPTVALELESLWITYRQLMSCKVCGFGLLTKIGLIASHRPCLGKAIAQIGPGSVRRACGYDRLPTAGRTARYTDAISSYIPHIQLG